MYTYPRKQITVAVFHKGEMTVGFVFREGETSDREKIFRRL